MPDNFFTPDNQFYLIAGGVAIVVVVVVIALILRVIDRQHNVPKVTGYLNLLPVDGTNSATYKLLRRRMQKWNVANQTCGVQFIDIELEEGDGESPSVFVSVFGRDGFRFFSRRLMREGDEVAIGTRGILARNPQKASMTTNQRKPRANPLDNL